MLKTKKLNGIYGRNAVVTGATGGVGSFAIKLLKLLGANVTAITTKLNEEGFLKMIGADEIISKKDFIISVRKPMGKEFGILPLIQLGEIFFLISYLV